MFVIFNLWLIFSVEYVTWFMSLTLGHDNTGDCVDYCLQIIRDQIWILYGPDRFQKKI